MRDEFGFDAIRSVEFCVSALEGHDHTSYLVPSDNSVQAALRTMLTATVQQFEAADDGTQLFDLAEKYAPSEALVADLPSEDMATIHALYDEEGWPPNAQVLRNPAQVAYYFAVFRDRTQRKLLGVRQAAQFKGIVKSHLIRLLDDSLTMVDDHLFKLDFEFDFLITAQHVYILHPVGFGRIAQLEERVSAKARENALLLGDQIAFADFARVAEFVAHHKRAARLVAALTARGGLDLIKKNKFTIAAHDTGVILEKVGRKIRPATGSELAFLELLDRRRYTTAITEGPKEAYIASSRRPV